LDQMAARALLEIVPAFEDLARPRSEHGLAPPVKLDAPRAFVPDDGCAEVWPWELGPGRCSALERVVDGDIDGLEPKVCAVEVGHATARCFAYLGHASSAQVARDHRLAYERHGSEQEFDYGIARPISERLRQVDMLASARQFR